MRYKCIGSPHCMKTFEYGHALRAHIGACDQAQKILRSKAEIEKLEHDVAVDYPGIYGLHRNPHFPTAHSIDQTLKFHFVDKNKFNSDAKPEQSAYRPHRKSLGVNLMDSSDVKKALTYK